MYVHLVNYARETPSPRHITRYSLIRMEMASVSLDTYVFLHDKPKKKINFPNIDSLKNGAPVVFGKRKIVGMVFTDFISKRCLQIVRFGMCCFVRTSITLCGTCTRTPCWKHAGIACSKFQHNSIFFSFVEYAEREKNAVFVFESCTYLDLCILKNFFRWLQN